MESPVRICLGAAVIVNLLLLNAISSSALPLQDTLQESTKEKTLISRLSKNNNTEWISREKTEDVAINELKPKESPSAEQTDTKSSKYKDRGRIKFHSNLKSSTEATRTRAIKTTPEAPKITIVTPTPEQKNLSQIIDSMREFKKTKIPILASSSTTPTSADEEESSSDEDEEYDDDDDFTKYTPGKFHDSNFYTMPGFTDDDFSQGSKTNNKLNNDYTAPPYEKFSSYFPKEISYGPERENYKSDSYFHDFEGDLTTPKHDFFDKKFHEISSSILNNLALVRKHTPAPNETNVHKIVKENVGLERLSNGSPNNKSMVIIKNTKEVHLLDNEKAGSTNKELSDVHGTSIYYEMSVLSTETYTIHNDDDCDNDTSPFDPTPSTSYSKEKVSTKSTVPSLFSLETKSSLLSPVSNGPPITSTFESSTENPFKKNTEFTSTYRTTPKVSGFSIRQRGYPKRINFPSKKETSNSVTVKSELSSNQHLKPVNTRRIQYTTPKTKPMWMAPRRNISRHSYVKPTPPTTIYSEYFNIKDKFNSKISNRTSALSTISSDIDPVYQTDVGGSKKVVHSQSISDNSIPGLRKRGSAKFSSTPSTQNSTAIENSSTIMEIPPTSTAWALAGMRNPPSLTSPLTNRTNPVQKPVDDNELQNVGEIIEKKVTTIGPTTPTKTEGNINVEFTSKKIYEVDQNRLPWKPVYTPSSTQKETKTEAQIVESVTESKPDKLSAESNISLQNNIRFETTMEPIKHEDIKQESSSSEQKEMTAVPAWISVNDAMLNQSTTENISKTTDKEQIQPDSNVNTAFESITKLPSDLTTPHSDDIISPFIFDYSSGKEESTYSHNTARPFTTSMEPDDEITTIRFSYVPTVTEESIETTQTSFKPDIWHPVRPIYTKTETTESTPITTYRPKFVTTTGSVDETTVMTEATSSPLELSSSTIMRSSTSPQRVETSGPLTTDNISSPMELITENTKKSFETTPKTEETTTITFEVVTEINTEREITTILEISTKSPYKDITTNDFSTEADSITQSSAESAERSSESHEFITKSDLTSTEIIEDTTTPVRIETTEESRYYTTTTSRPEMTALFPIKPTESVKHTALLESTSKISTTESTNPTLKLTTDKEEYVESTSEMTTRSVSDLDDLSSYGEMTTEKSPIVINDGGSGAAVAIAVSTIGVIALIMLIGLLLVVRRRGRRGVYAQRCTPVSLDAYSLDSVSVGPRKGNQRLRASKRSYGNPAYDDEVTSHPMQYAALANFAMDTESMTTEFSEIPSVTVRPDEVPAGCEDKNRYSNVLPLPETRVPLQRIGNDPASDYINANYITGPGNIKNYYIACQAPLANTVADFWRMIWEQNSRLIVMLTEYMENGVEKCYEYLPPSEISDSKRIFGDYEIVLKKREQRDKYAISSVQLTNLNTRTWREITHLWYFWPAKGLPDDYDSIIDFMSEMRGYMKVSQTAKEYDEEGVEVIYGNDNRSSFNNLSKLRSEDGAGNGVNVYSPQKAEEMMRRANNGTLGRMKAAADVEGVRSCVVVCASGAGRSAAVIALDICARALAAGRVDVPRVVREIRAQRPHSLANRHHYIFLYKVLSEYGNKLMGGGVDSI